MKIAQHMEAWKGLKEIEKRLRVFESNCFEEKYAYKTV